MTLLARGQQKGFLMKKWFASKTFWFNLISIVIVILNEILKIAPGAATYLTFAIAIGNLVLRLFFTEQKIG